MERSLILYDVTHTHFEALPGRTDKNKVEVKKIEDPDDAESQLVLCRSAQRGLNEVAMLANAEELFSLMQRRSLNESKWDA